MYSYNKDDLAGQMSLVYGGDIVLCISERARVDLTRIRTNVRMQRLSKTKSCESEYGSRYLRKSDADKASGATAVGRTCRVA